jgi:hypothetical protein
LQWSVRIQFINAKSTCLKCVVVNLNFDSVSCSDGDPI